MSHTYKFKWGSILKSIGNKWSKSQVLSTSLHAQALEFYQCETNSIFIFQLWMWDKPSLLQLQHETTNIRTRYYDVDSRLFYFFKIILFLMVCCIINWWNQHNWCYDSLQHPNVIAIDPKKFGDTLTTCLVICSPILITQDDWGRTCMHAS